jgi:putative ABC transport system substrate-binding protein
VDRRAFIAVLTGGLLAAPLAAEAQPAGKVYRIAFLGGGSSTDGYSEAFREAFRQGLRELGWVEGQNILIDYRFAKGTLDRLPALAAELVRLKVDVIVAAPTPAVVAARNATQTIPIVMINVGDPVGLGLVASLARPGGNVTGIAFAVGVEVFGKELELLKETVPKARHVAVLSNPVNSAHALAISNVSLAARSLGVQLLLLEARDPDELDRAFRKMTKERVGALLVLADTVFLFNRARLADLATKNRLASIHALRENVEAGGLMSYGPKSSDLFRRAATYVDKILMGAKPGDLPVVEPSMVELVIILTTAEGLGL